MGYDTYRGFGPVQEHCFSILVEKNIILADFRKPLDSWRGLLSVTP
jgi:hypothetical protein